MPRTRVTIAALLVTVLGMGCASAQDRPIRDLIGNAFPGRAQQGTAPDATTSGALQLMTLRHQGTERSYYIHVPASLQGRGNLPAVLMFHGGEGDGRSAEAASRLSTAAAAGGFVAVFPNSPGQQWNDGRATTASSFDDVDFVRALVGDLQDRHGIDPDRVFAAGMSNGGMFTQRLACDAAGVFAAYAVGVANLPRDLEGRCAPARPAPMVFFNGTADRLMPFEGGEIATSRLLRAGVGGTVLSYAQTQQFWAESNGCAPGSGPRALPDRVDDGTSVRFEEIGGCAGGAVLQFYTIDGGGHTWPGATGRGARVLGPVSQEVDATAEIIGFFRRFGL